MKNHFGDRVGKYDPITELARDFCGGIGPLLLGVVLVFLSLTKQCIITATGILVSVWSTT